MSTKTAVSIDDALLQEADEAAGRMGLSRSRLFALAVSEFLQRKKNEQMLRQLNDVYAGGMTAEERRLIPRLKAKVRRVKDRE